MLLPYTVVMGPARTGYESKAAYSVKGAVQAVLEWTPHLAIIDVRLKVVNGVAFAILLQEQFQGCEVALFTGLSDLSALLERAQDSGHFFEVISKPIHPTDILRIAARKLATLDDGKSGIA